MEVELERLTVRAPVAGMVLQLNVRAGEFAPAGALSTPLVLMGTVDPLHVRVDIDENDAWRFQHGAAATASVRGNREIATALEFAYLEPYVVPKRSLTGDTAERVDTRVMQAVFRFERGALPIRVGQQMDVFIEVTDEPADAAPSVDSVGLSSVTPNRVSLDQ
jgi:HlyD family secretion protein